MPIYTAEPQGMGPTIITNTVDGKYAYVGFHLSETIAKVRLADLTVEGVADLSQYFPLQCYRMALDVSEKKLFVHSAAWRKLIVLDTQTLSAIHTIDGIDASGMIRSQDGRLIIWDGGNTVRFVNTETYAVTEFTDLSIGFLQIQESPSDPGKWYVATQLGPGAPWTIGLYDYVAKAWIHTVTIPMEGDTPGIWDFKVIPNESKLYAAAVGGWYPQEYHAYGWVYSIDLLGWQVKTIPIDGGAASLETSPDSRRVYVGTNEPKPNDTNNILVIDVQSDTILGPIPLGRSKYNWPYGEIRDVQVDLANPDLLYAVSNDANALIKADLKNFSLAGDTIFNVQDLTPHFFARQPLQPSGYVLVHQKAYGFELDIESADINNVVRFPAIRVDSGAYDVAITNAGRLLIAQGEQVLEVDGTDMQLIANHPLPSTIPSVWNFVLSKDQSRLYSITTDPITKRSNIFLAINTADFQAQANFPLAGGAFDFRPFELPDGSKLYALGGEDFGTTVVHVIRTDNYIIQKTITFDEPGSRGVSGGPYYPYAYDANSHTLYVGATFVVLAIDTDTDEIKQVIHLEEVAGAIGLEPWQFIFTTAIGLVYQPEENFLYITHFDRSFVSIYDLNNSQFLPQVIPLKGFLPGYVFANDNVSKIYVLNTRSDNISVIDVNSKTEEKIIDLHAYVAPPAPFDKSTPVDRSGSQPASLTLNWACSTGATSYEYCYDTTNDNICSSWTDNGMSMSKALSGLSNGTTYYWHVRAINAGGITYADGASTAFWSFTTRSQLSVPSTGTQDGWILESTEISNKGGALNATATTFRLGDDAARKQYRGILSFATGAPLPDNAVITKVTLKVRKQGILGGGNPDATFQGFMVDIKKGLFGTSALQAADFQTKASKVYGPFTTALAGGWYTIDLTGGKAYINKLATGGGLTQIRLRFKVDDNNNTVANYLSLHSGDAAAASRPQLIIEYYVP